MAKIVECKYCLREFDAKRSTARYCSAVCRKLAFQGDENAKDGTLSENAKASVTTVTKLADPPSVETVSESPDAAAFWCSPLDVYSEDRWTYLQGKGHVWDPDKQRGVRADGLIGVVVPGDPAYGPVVGGQCRSCGGPVQHQVIAKCLKCCTAGVPNAPTTPPKTFDDLPLDAQHQIDKRCSESNNGDRADSHSRAAMTERAIAYQRVAGAGKVAV